MALYTLADLEKAQLELDREIERWDNYNGNNPNKYQSDIKSARQQLLHIEEQLKSAGTIPLSDKEKLNRELDQLFPNASSKEIVKHNGVSFIKRFRPREKSRSGKTVTAWVAWWEEAKA